MPLESTSGKRNSWNERIKTKRKRMKKAKKLWICGSLKHARHLTEKIAVNENKCVRCDSTAHVQYALRSHSHHYKIAAYNGMVLTVSTWHAIPTTIKTHSHFQTVWILNWIWRMRMNEHECIWCVQKRFNLFEISSWIVHKLTLPWQWRVVIKYSNNKSKHGLRWKHHIFAGGENVFFLFLFFFFFCKNINHLKTKPNIRITYLATKSTSGWFELYEIKMKASTISQFPILSNGRSHVV